jgi:CO/xanthine dehydrogenase FAD-binding subunit
MTVASPATLADAVGMLGDGNDWHVLAGGTDLMVEVNFNHRRPQNVLSLSRVAELRDWRETATSWEIGAGVTWARLESGPLAAALPALAEAARTVGSPQIRAAGTIGGNLGTCSPAGDGLPVLSALGASVVLQSAAGSRSVPFAEFMTGPKRSVRLPSELVTGVSIPKTEGWQGYSKVGVRNAMVISIASACLVIDRGSVRVALGSVGPTIIRATEAETWLDGLNAVSARAVTSAVAREFGERVAREARPIDDHRSTAAYRRHAVSVIATRLLEKGTRP